MIVLDPENVGCGRKIAPSVLARYQDVLASVTGRAAQNGDFSIRMNETGDLRVSSIDRTVRFCSSNHVFVAAALAHAGNDVLAGGALPDFVEVSIGIARRELEGQGDEIVRTLAEVSTQMGLRVGKLHTFIDAETNLTVAISGPRSLVLDEKPAPEGKIVLTKPIGALKATYLASIGHKVDEIDEVTRLISSWQAPLTKRVFSGLHGVTDVSGFGLAHAVDQMLTAMGLEGVIDVEKIPLVSTAVNSISVDCLNRGVGSRLSSLAVRNSDANSIEFLSETNGPMAMLVSAESYDELMREGALTESLEVGEWKAK